MTDDTDTTIRALQAALVAKDELINHLVAKYSRISEVLTKAAERGRVCAACARAFTLEDLQQHPPLSI